MTTNRTRTPPVPATQISRLGLTVRTLIPAHHLEATTHDGQPGWSTKGNDPQFMVDLGPDGLEPGWYLVNARFRVQHGRLAMPCFYPDYGSGFSETAAVPMLDPEGSQMLAVACFHANLSRLRFDPSITSCDFSLDEFSLTRISRVHAARLILRGLRETSRVSRASLAHMVLKALFREGPGAFGDWLYGSYLQRGKGSGGYTDWVDLFDHLRDDERERLSAYVASLPSQPTISIVMPVYNTPEKWLRRCIDSVRAQTYPHWQLCIADDASPKRHVRSLLKKYAASDPRIKVVFRESNGHISEASNSALQLASGDYIALLDHDDELPPHALHLVSKTLAENPELKLVYSDEDKIDEHGRRFDPYFKPDWNPDLLRSQNYICHLGVYSRALVQAVGGFRKGFEGSQDYDLALRCIEQLKPEEIGHIPHVLYHWRAISGSTALAMGEKNYAAEAGRRALEEHLARTGRVGAAQVQQGGYRVQYSLPAPQPKVTLIIPTRDRVDLLRMCIGSILAKTDYANYEILIVDNQSTDPETLAYFGEIQHDSRVRVLPYDAPFNYSLINNFAASRCDGEIVGLVNNDIEVIHADWLSEMVSQAIRSEIGAVGAMLYYPNDTLQHAGVVVGLGGLAGHAYLSQPRGYAGQMWRARLVQNLSAVTAACLLVRRSVFDEVGGLDEGLQVAFNDVDFCLRIRASGYLNLWTPHAELYHHESASRGYEDTPEKKQRFNREIAFVKRRWGDSLLSDPAYNPNLTLSGHNFELAPEPRVSLRAALGLNG
ncbi:MAG: glycosyltransferase family 2 protein [Rhodanobacter sp.]